MEQFQPRRLSQPPLLLPWARRAFSPPALCSQRWPVVVMARPQTMPQTPARLYGPDSTQPPHRHRLHPQILENGSLRCATARMKQRGERHGMTARKPPASVTTRDHPPPAWRESDGVDVPGVQPLHPPHSTPAGRLDQCDGLTGVEQYNRHVARNAGRSARSIGAEPGVDCAPCRTMPWQVTAHPG